ncbi:MAG TPA: hypothetical protein VLF43_02160 [Candidatus Saccharimonadales bacterium]|nr:hypothetical protein [Candidatus Saccharimonadales bacterium]
MERAPRITSVNEQEVLEARRRNRMREAAARRAAETRKKAVTAITLIRMMFQLAITPNRQVGKVVRRNVDMARQARRVASGDYSRVLALGSNAVNTSRT